MAFLDRLVHKAPSPTDAALIGAVAILALDREVGDLERRLISLLRDQFPPLSPLDDGMFSDAVNRAMQTVREQKITADVPGFIQNTLATGITKPQERYALYKYLYALATADLTVEGGEASMLGAMKTGLTLGDSWQQAEAEVITEFRTLHHAIAATVLGLIVVTSDGTVRSEELENIKQARVMLEPIAKLDDVQFDLVYELALNIHDRFLLDLNNRQQFLTNILTAELNDPNVRFQAFHYAASIATSDADISGTEVEILKSLLTILQIPEEHGEAAFNHYMERVKTIDGKPR